jgi:phosphatidylserine decarboxylase
MIKYYDRRMNTYNKENVAGEGILNFIYSNSFAKTFLPDVASKKILTKLYGVGCDSKFSRRYIKNFVNKFNINMDEYEKNIDEYNSFNDFFYRRLSKNSRNICNDEKSFISPCDGKLLAIDKLDENSSFAVKGFKYTLSELLQNEDLSKEYSNGTCLVFRLCPTDYHRFHFVDSGVCSQSKFIKGKYYSVNPVALENISKVFSENKREYSILKSHNFDDVIYIEVGATFVGSIIQTYSSSSEVNRGDEKGYFKFGGSTVIVVLKENILKIDEDICYQSKLGIETSVYMGEKIGVRI